MGVGQSWGQETECKFAEQNLYLFFFICDFIFFIHFLLKFSELLGSTSYADFFQLETYQAFLEQWFDGLYRYGVRRGRYAVGMKVGWDTNAKGHESRYCELSGGGSVGVLGSKYLSNLLN